VATYRFWSFRSKAPTEDAETTWLDNEFQRFTTSNFYPVLSIL